MVKSKLKNLPQVGKGGFSRCYELDPNTVLLESYDPIKKVMAEGKFPNSKLFPKVEFFDNPFDVGGEFYTMYYYKGRKSRSTQKWLRENLKPFHFSTYMDLYYLRKKVDEENKGKRGQDKIRIWNEAFDSLENKKISKILKKAYNACCETATNITFDCEPKNVTPHKGNLILLDCFYSSTLFYKIKFSKDTQWALNWEKR